jgi:TrmH family RNA methyltransferase
VLICDDIQDPGNLGTILRTAEAAGVTTTLLTPDCVDLYNPKVVRAGMGAHFRLPALAGIGWDEVAELLHELDRPSDRVFATEAHEDRAYDENDWSRPSALIVSNEAHGLSKQAREASSQLLAIPMLGGTESLNAAMAAAVVLFEAARQRRKQAHSE